MVPGMNHCQGGPGTDTFDQMGAIEQWIKTGTGAEAHRGPTDPPLDPPPLFPYRLTHNPLPSTF